MQQYYTSIMMIVNCIFSAYETNVQGILCVNTTMENALESTVNWG